MAREKVYSPEEIGRLIKRAATSPKWWLFVSSGPEGFRLLHKLWRKELKGSGKDAPVFFGQDERLGTVWFFLARRRLLSPDAVLDMLHRLRARYNLRGLLQGKYVTLSFYEGHKAELERCVADAVHGV